MSPAFPPEDLDCVDPDNCPVAISDLVAHAQAGTLPVATLDEGTQWHRIYDSRFGRTEFNPGLGNARFSPFDSKSDGERVPSLYLASSPGAALLEAVLRNLGPTGPREVDEASFVGMLHVHLDLQQSCRVADLRDNQLSLLKLSRESIASSSAEHYPCTRTVAKEIHASPQKLCGILWHSRQVEMNGLPPEEALVLFGDHLPPPHQLLDLPPTKQAIGSLFEGQGRVYLDELLEELGVSVADLERPLLDSPTVGVVDEPLPEN